MAKLREDFNLNLTNENDDTLLLFLLDRIVKGIKGICKNINAKIEDTQAGNYTTQFRNKDTEDQVDESSVKHGIT